MIYFVQSGANGLVKIGFTASHPRHRLAGLQTGSAERLRIIGLTDGTRADEAEWHRRFAHLCVHGEWFRWVGELKRAARPFLQETFERQWKAIARDYAEIVIMLRNRGHNPPITNPDIIAEIDRLASEES